MDLGGIIEQLIALGNDGAKGLVVDEVSGVVTRKDDLHPFCDNCGFLFEECVCHGNEGESWKV